MKPSHLIVTGVFLLGISLSKPVGAQDSAPTSPYSGDLWTRSTLTGDWGGLRNTWAAKGITFDASVTQVAQGVVDGGKSGQWQSGGRSNLTLNADSQKLGLWPGGFLTLEAEGNWASAVNPDTGALMPVDNNQLFPFPPGDFFTIPAVTFMQFVSPYAGGFLGKLDTTGGDMNEFAHGKGDTNFMNTAMNFNAAALFTAPYSSLGAGVIVLPTKDPNAAILNFSVMQTNGLPYVAGFDDLDANKLTFGGEGRVRTDFFGLTGHQVVGAMFSNVDFGSIDQNVRIIIGDRELTRKKGSWNMHYNFDQYLYEPEKGSGEGIGIFGRFGASDGNPNFMHYVYSFGFGGKGVVPNRHNDRYGLGFYYIDVNPLTLEGPIRTRSALRDEYGVEAFYNVAITPWLQLTPDIQIVKGAQKDRVVGVGQGNLGRPTINKKSIDTAVVLGFRLQVLF